MTGCLTFFLVINNVCFALSFCTFAENNYNIIILIFDKTEDKSTLLFFPYNNISIENRCTTDESLFHQHDYHRFYLLIFFTMSM